MANLDTQNYIIKRESSPNQSVVAILTRHISLVGEWFHLMRNFFIYPCLSKLVCLGKEQRSFCRFWDCIQVLHFRLFCWPWHVKMEAGIKLASQKAMAAHSSVLAWRIPGTGEPHGLPSMGSHRVGHDWSDLAAAASSGSDDKESVYNAGNPGSVSRLGDTLEKGMATHSNILAWRILWTEKPGGL